MAIYLGPDDDSRSAVRRFCHDLAAGIGLIILWIELWALAVALGG